MIREIVLATLLLQTAPVAPVLIPRGMHAYSMSSASMQPTIDDRDVLLVDRPGEDCGTTRPAPGDVVVIRRNGAPWVKRVVAGPGQQVEMENGLLIIDGAPVTRADGGAETDDHGVHATRVRETLSNGVSYLTLDRGPYQPMDYFQPIVVPEGHWFTLGDNRDNSLDGREFGPTPSSDLCGIAIRIIRSTDPTRIGVRP